MILYKYRTAKQAIEIIKDGNLVFSPPSLFSDPFECRPAIKSLDDEDELIRSIGISGSSSGNYTYNSSSTDINEPEVTPEEIYIRQHYSQPKNMGQLFVRMMIDDTVVNADILNIGILSLSSVNNSPLMWGQYADEHKGVVIGFNCNNELFAPSNDGYGIPMKVQYSTERPSWTASKIQHARYLTKSVDYMYEHEWRILRSLSDANGIAIPFIDDDANIIWKPKRRKFKYNYSAITEVILGDRINIEHVRILISLINSMPELQHVAINSAFVDDNEYKMYIGSVPNYLNRNTPKING